MKKLFLLLALFFTACTVNQSITYTLSDNFSNNKQETIPASVNVRTLIDNRSNVKGNNILLTQPRETYINRKRYCINSEEHYRKEPVVNQITRLMVDHFKYAKLFSQVSYNENIAGDYYLTGTLNSFYGIQEFSTAAEVGTLFGLIGALATMNTKTPGIIVIEISNLKLFKTDGTLIKNFGNFYKKYEEDFSATANCWCIYCNINEKLKDFNVELIEKIRTEMLKIKF